MQCPNCKTQMEEEYVPLMGDARIAVPRVCSHVKSWHYRCDECDAEWVKVGQEKLRLLDGMDRSIERGGDFQNEETLQVSR